MIPDSFGVVLSTYLFHFLLRLICSALRDDRTPQQYHLIQMPVSSIGHIFQLRFLDVRLTDT